MSSNYAGANTYPANVQIPSDGDPRNASSVNAAFEGLADRTAWLKGQVDTFKPSHALIELNTVSVGDAGEFEPVHASWIDATYGTPVALATFAQATLVGDVVEVVLSGHCDQNVDTGTSSPGYLRVEASQNGGGYAEIPGAKASFMKDELAGAAFEAMPFTVHACFTITVAGTLDLQVQGRQVGADGAGGNANGLLWEGAYAFVGKIWRPVP